MCVTVDSVRKFDGGPRGLFFRNDTQVPQRECDRARSALQVSLRGTVVRFGHAFPPVELAGYLHRFLRDRGRRRGPWAVKPSENILTSSLATRCGLTAEENSRPDGKMEA